MNITFQKYHKCSECCAERSVVTKTNTGYIVSSEPNPNYVDGKCPKYGVLECSSVRIHTFSAPTSTLFQGDDIIIDDNTISLLLDYPLDKPYRNTLVSSDGFSRNQVLNEIKTAYETIYQEEEATATEYEFQWSDKRTGKVETYVGKIIPLDVRYKMGTMINRNTTDGKWGIWGHDLCDLVIESLYYDPQTKELTPRIGS